MKTALECASAYLAKMSPSISKKRGHDAAFCAALVLVRGFDLSEEEALPLLSHWNRACDPPWEESDLRYKLRSAATASDKPAGYLLNQTLSSSREVPRSNEDAQDAADAGSSHTACSSSQRIPQATTLDPASPDDRAWLRTLWPEFRPLSREDISRVARQRGIFPDAVDLAHRHGFLRVAEVQDHPCLIITEGRFAQARRLDAQPLRNSGGALIKARNLSGSQGAFIGQRWLGETTHVLLVEGAIGLIEGLAAMLLVNTPHPWSILAATSASSRFARDPELMERLRGRQVHLVPDSDGPGMDAAASWLADLQAAGVHATTHFLPKPCKDLGDVFHLPEADRLGILNEIFLPPPQPLSPPLP
ncbi:MAG: hypothetical protein JWR15_2850 [Prosthecobacter sp.]|nr:hypothetical protein [Prosthecobacter sp.]